MTQKARKSSVPEPDSPIPGGSLPSDRRSSNLAARRERTLLAPIKSHVPGGKGDALHAKVSGPPRLCADAPSGHFSNNIRRLSV
jgi:hypothetical protein